MAASVAIGTPRRNFGRRSLLNGIVVASPLRQSYASGSTVALLPVDDEQERSKRRSIIETQRRLASISGSNQSPVVETSSLDEAHVQDHLKACVKLYAENRISAKNAWQLHVIDAMRKFSAEGSSNVLQVAGSSLDVGAKVYGLRVDDIHAKGLQLASSMLKTNEQTAQENDEETLADVTTQHREVRRKRVKKIANDKRNTIDSERKTLLTLVEQIELPVFATKENIDISAIDNLFAHKLPTDPSSHEVVTMSTEKYWSLGPDQILETHIKNVPKSSEPVQCNLCAPLENFDIGAWDPEKEKERLTEKSIVLPVVLDDNGVPVAELDGSINDIFEDDRIADDPPSDDEQREEVFHAQVHGEIGHIVDALPDEALIETDYSFNLLVKTTSGKYVDKIWAGPCHWKVKFNKRSTPRYTGTTQAVAKQKKTKEVAPFDFSLIDYDEDEILELLGKFSAKRGPPTTTSEKITLPAPEFELSMTSFYKLINELLIKPGVPRPRINNNIRTQQDFEVQGYNYENLNEYCSRHSEFDDNAETAYHSFEEVHVQAQEQFWNENLMNASEPVAPIAYAMQAKKIDMKKLKGTIWNCLGQNTEQQKIVNFKPTRFSTLYQDLHHLLSTDMKKELTSPLAVVALLHLCNENNLILQADSDHKDFVINKAEAD